MTLQHDIPQSPRSLRSVEMIKSRKAMLEEAHIKPLTDYIKGLGEKYPGVEFQNIDPLDGGCHADILFLLEKPGPKTSEKGEGSGFISRDNDDPTAEAVFKFMNEIGLNRKRTILWNVIPGWNGTRKVTQKEVKEGVAELENLLPLLPNLKVVVLVGRRAERAKKFIKVENVITSLHPSPIVRARYPEDWKKIPEVWKQVLDM